MKTSLEFLAQELEMSPDDLRECAKNMNKMKTKYKIETHFGCTSNSIIVNGKGYTGEDPRYCLSEEDRKEFEKAFLSEVNRMFDDGEIGVYELLRFFEVERTERSETCDTCGDEVESNYYYPF